MLVTAFISSNFGETTFNASELTKKRPHIIYPDFGDNPEELQIFDAFSNKYAEDKSFITASINCIKYSVTCSKLKLKQHYLSFAKPEFTAKSTAVLSNRKITPESLDDFAFDIVPDYMHVLDSLDEIKKFAQKRTLFLYTTRPNYGQLPLQKSVYRQVAESMIHRNIMFVYSENSDVYNLFGKSPYSSLVYISPSEQFIRFNGDFNFDEVTEFIQQHDQFPGESPSPAKGPSITVFNRSREILKDFSEIIEFPLVYMDPVKEKDLSKLACGAKRECVSLIDFSNYRYIEVEDISTIIFDAANFDAKWNSLNPAIRALRHASLLLVSDIQLSMACFALSIVVFLVLIMFVYRLTHNEKTYKENKKSKTE